MKKYTKHIFSLILAAVMMFGMAISGFAAGGTVTYHTNNDKPYEFTPSTAYSVTDLFSDEFKNLMPGDEIDSYTVRIHNNGKAGHTTKIYMRALGPKTTDDFTEGNIVVDKTVRHDLLDYLTLTVTVEKGNKELFNDKANVTGGLTDWVLLGSMRKGDEVDLKLTLDVSKDLSDPELRNAAAAIDWQFKVEEIPDPPQVPDTGDNTGALLYGGIFGIAALALLVIIVLKKRTREE